MREIDYEMSAPEVDEIFARAFELTGIDPDDVHVSCDMYGVPASYLATQPVRVERR